MPDGTSVGNVYLDLVVRDTLAKQLQTMAQQAKTSMQKSFEGMGKAAGDALNKSLANTAGNVFNKQIALIQARMKDLEKSFDRITDKADAMWQQGKRTSDPAFARVLDQQKKVEAQIEYLREKLAIEVQAQAQKQAAAEQAAYAKTAQAAENAAKRQQEAARQAHTTTGPPTAIRSINTDNAVRSSFTYLEEESQAAASRAQNIWLSTLGKIASGFKNLLGKALSSIGKIGSTFVGLAKTILPFNVGVKQAGTGMHSLATRLRSIVSGALVFNVISAGLRQMTSYIGNALTSTTQMQAALANLKGAAATAAAPIIQILTPALAALANAAATVFSYISQLISFFTGKSISAMSSAAKGMAGVGSAASGTAKKVKEATRSLADFDEITKLDAPQKDTDTGGGGGGSGGSAITPNYDFKGKSPFLDSILEAIKAGDWYQVGRLLGEKLRDSLNAIPWPDIQAKARQWASNLADTINGFVETPGLWEAIGHTLAQGMNTALYFLDDLVQQIHWQSLGEGLGKGLNQMVAELDWAAFGRVLTDKLKIQFEMLHGFVQTFDFTALGTSFATATTAAINNVDWVQAFGDGSAFIMGVLQTMITWVQGIDWASLGQMVLDCLLAINWAGILENLFTFIGSLIGAAAQFLLPFFTSFGDWCKDQFTENGKFTAQGFLDGILDLFNDIGTWVKDHMIDPLVDAVKSMLGIHSPSTVFQEIGTNVVLGMLNGLSKTWGKITSFFSSSLSAIKNAVTNAWNAILATTSSIWNGIANTIRSVVNSILSVINGMLRAVVNALNSVIGVLNNFSFDVPSWAQDALGTSKVGFNISKVTAPQIPMLASGGIIRKPTLAMMGEYSGAQHNPEIAAPQSTIEKIMESANSDVVDAILQAAQQIIEAIRANGGEYVDSHISDEIIGRAADQYRLRQAVITGRA